MRASAASSDCMFRMLRYQQGLREISYFFHCTSHHHRTSGGCLSRHLPVARAQNWSSRVAQGYRAKPCVLLRTVYSSYSLISRLWPAFLPSRLNRGGRTAQSCLNVGRGVEVPRKHLTQSHIGRDDPLGTCIWNVLPPLLLSAIAPHLKASSPSLHFSRITKPSNSKLEPRGDPVRTDDLRIVPETPHRPSFPRVGSRFAAVMGSDVVRHGRDASLLVYSAAPGLSS